MTRTCTVTDCDDPHEARGWCRKHYKWHQRRGLLDRGVLTTRFTCTIEDCPEPHLARGWCGRHYASWRRHGDPTVDKRSRPLRERFWEKVQKSDFCWEWTGYTQRNGYGQIGVDGRLVVAHRVAYELEVGPIPEGLELDHLCLGRACVRPSHLEPVTHKENKRRAALMTAYGISA